MKNLGLVALALVTRSFVVGVVLVSIVLLAGFKNTYAQPAGLLSRWTGDGNSDDTVGGNNGTLVNGATYTTGVLGQAFAFDGVDDYLQAPTVGLPTGSSDRTLTMWVRIDAPVTTESFFGGYGNFGESTHTYHLGASGSLNALFFSVWGNGVSGPQLQNGRWYHVAVKNNGNQATLYLDGLAVNTGAFTIATSANSQFYLGIPVPGGNIRRLQGAVDDVRVYNRALSPEEIQSVYNERSIKSPFDYDGDGRADVSVFRPSDGAWYLQQSTAGFAGVSFGNSTDKITPADFDGDAKTDVAVYRPESGTWYWLNSSNGAFNAAQFGSAEDLPTPADYDGDGRADLSVFRPSNGTWYRLNSSNGSFYAVQFGVSEDKPTIGDFDGDGRADIAVWRPSNGAWYRLNSSNGAFIATSFGLSDDLITPADFDGDGKTDVAVYRSSSGTWYSLNSSDGALIATQFGVPEDLPTAADFDGDGKADVSVFRPSNGSWYRLNSGNGLFFAVQFGTNGDRPTPSAFRF